MDMWQTEQAYRNDAMFKAVVDTLTHWIVEMKITPAEARSAAMYACVRVEQMRPPKYQLPTADSAPAPACPTPSP